VQELLDGTPRPLTVREFEEWQVYFQVKNEREKEANRANG